MEKAQHRAAIALLVVALAAALAPSSGAVTLGSGALLAAPSTQQCHTIRIKKRVRRWAWIPKTRRVHARRVVIRRAGRIVHVHARVWRRKTALRVVCTPTAAVVAPPGATTALTPLPLAAPEPAAPPPPAAPPAAPPPQLPSNTTPPTITGTALQGQILTATPGTWSGSPSAFSYAWLRCDPAGANCTPIPLATTSAYSVVEADLAHTLRVVVTASNAGGSSAPITSTATEPVTASPRPPVNTLPPAILGVAQQGLALTHDDGFWLGEPTTEADQWLACDASGSSCQPIAAATADTYTPTAGDVGHTLRLAEMATNAAGPSPPASSAPSEVVTTAAQVPVNTGPPAIFGSAQEGQTLTASPGAWANDPTTFSFKWKRCSASGASCAAILGATSSTYTLGEADIGSTLRVTVVASNAAGASAPASSAPTEVVAAAAGQVPTNVALPAIAGLVEEGHTLTAEPGGWTGSPSAFSYEWLRCDSTGASCTPIALATGATYVLTEADVGSTLRLGVIASNAAGSSAPATSAPTAVVTAAPHPPSNISPPSIAGIAQAGQTLTADTGSWTNSPTTYSYAWSRCGAGGGSCKAIEGTNAATYLLTEADVGSTLRVAVVASNATGTSLPATSAQTDVVAAAERVLHLEYVLRDGVMSVYDMDHEFQLVKTISLPQTQDEVRGVSVAPATHTMYIMHGGDGPTNGSGNGSVLAYDLVAEQVVWDAKLNSGVDSGQVSPDATKLYVPTGENTASGIWNVLSTANGEVIGTIQGGSGAHNTVASNDGRYVYLGGRASHVLDAYETATGATKAIGPLIGTERPFTVNGANTLAFTTATSFDGFQVSSIATGHVLYTVSFGEVPGAFPFTAPSHGIGLSPDEKQLYVIDAVHKEVQFWDVSKVQEGIAPQQIATVAVAGLTGTESPCAYDCSRGGWLQLSLDGRYLFVGDSGEIIDTAKREVITTLPTLAQTKKSIEVDWRSGVPIATSGRTGVGYVP